LLTAFGLSPSGSSTVHIYTQTIHGTTQLIWQECGLCELYSGICLTTEGKARKNLSQGEPKSASWNDEYRMYKTEKHNVQK